MLTSFCALSLEMVLIRAFQIILWHHLTFMVISLALLGYGASGSLLSIFPSLRERANETWLLMSILFPLSIILSARAAFSLPFDPLTLFWDPLSLLRLTFYYAVLAVPFASAGLIISLAYSRFPGSSPLLYMSDLMGGAAGCLAGPWLFAVSRGLGVPLVAAAAALIPLLQPGVRLNRRLAASTLPLILSFGMMFGPWALLPEPNPYKALPDALRHRGASILSTEHDPTSRIDVVSSPAIRGAPGLSLNFSGRVPGRIGVSVDGGLLATVPDGPVEKAFLDYLPSSLPYLLGPRKRVLLEDSRGGLPLFMAARMETREILAVEPYPLARLALEGRAGWTDDRRIRFVRGWARNLLTVSDDKFDLIEIDLSTVIGPASTGLMPSLEDYRLTEEAMGIYLDHLTEGGIISLSTYLLPPPRTEGRLVSPALQVLGERFGDGRLGHIFCFRSFNTLTLLIKGTPFTDGELQRAGAFCSSRSFDRVFYPGMPREEANRFNVFPGPLYHDTFVALAGGGDIEGIYPEGPFDVEPVTDDRPFFFSFVSPGKLGQAASSLGGKLLPLLQSGLLVWFILLQAVIIGGAVILLPWAVRRRRETSGIPVLMYFSAIGLAYMLLEITWIQKFTLITGSPSAAASGIIAVFLFSSGLGGLFSRRIPTGGRSAPKVLACAAVTASTATILLHLLVAGGNPLPVSAPLLTAILLGLPAAFLMGTAFPMGVRRLGARGDVPWAFAVNGCLMVVGAALAPALAWQIGYLSTALMGGLLYLAAGLVYGMLPGAGSA